MKPLQSTLTSVTVGFTHTITITISKRCLRTFVANGSRLAIR
ncbi:Uncharacterised protein [Enterobacter cloacae]|nr:Uncharacterised protein [Enterobacter cloacae]